MLQMVRVSLGKEPLWITAVALAGCLQIGCSTPGANSDGSDAGVADGGQSAWICTASDLCCPLSELICEGNPDDGLYCRCPDKVSPETAVDAGGGTITDGGSSAVADSGAEAIDASATVADATSIVADAGSIVTDAGVAVTDAGVAVTDAGVAVTDAGVAVTDATVASDAEPCPSGCSTDQGASGKPPTCEDTCPYAGATACCEDSRLICRDDDGDGCVEWSFDVWCPNDCASGDCL